MFLKFACVLALAGCLIGCANKAEEQAAQMYELAGQYAKDRQFDQAIKVLQNIRINFEDTGAAGKAEDEISEYQRLKELHSNNQQTKVTTAFQNIGRALENYKVRFGFFPLMRKDLEKLPPDMNPEWNDPWGRPVHYKPTYSSGDLPRYEPDGYILASFGADGLPGGVDVDSDYFFKDNKPVRSLSGH